VESGRSFPDVSKVIAAYIIRAMIALTMEGASTSETSVNFYQTTRHNNPKGSHILTHRRKNLKSLISNSYPHT
jgi:hypothetical protein